MKVKTVLEHGNGYGAGEGIPFEKKHGRIYDIPDEREAQILIDAGIVEPADKRKG